MKSARQWRIFLVALAVLLFGIGAMTARAQSVITTVAGGGTTSNPPLANICLPVTAMTLYGGNIYFASCNQIYEETPQGTVTLIAGTGAAGYGGDGGPATSASLYVPTSLAFDPHGNLFLTDFDNARVREVLSVTGVIQTVAGNGVHGFSGDGSAAIVAELNAPEAVTVDASGNIFIADRGNGVIREVTATNGNIQTIAGGGTNFTFVNGEAATNLKFQAVSALFLDGLGNLYIADLARVYEMSLSAGTLTAIAGNGTPGRAINILQQPTPAILAEIYEPTGIFADTAGNIFIADTQNSVVQEVISSTGAIQTVFGNGTDSTSTGGTSAALNTPLLAPHGLFVDSSGDIFVSDNRGIWKSISPAGNVVLLASSASAGFNGDGLAATSATLLFPQNVAVDGSGNLLIADTLNQRVREVRASDGTLQTIGGNGTSPYSGSAASIEPWGIGFGTGLNLIYATEHILLDDSSQTSGLDTLLTVAPSTGATASVTGLGSFFDPNGLFVDSLGDIFVTDTLHNKVVKLVAGGVSLQTVAGSSVIGGTVGDGGPATSAALEQPHGVSVDGSGNLFIADTANSRIREVLAANGTIQTVAGTTLPNGFGFSGDGGPATSAQITVPEGVAVDGSGNIFIADTGNNRIREVVTATGNIQTIAGTGVSGFSGDGGLATNAQLNQPTGLAFDLQGNLLIVDSYNSRIRKLVAAAPAVSASTTSLSFSGQLFGTTSNAMTVILTNSGNEALSISAAPSIGGTNSADFAVASGTTCTDGATLALGGSCVVNVTFTPGAAGNRGTATLTIANTATSSSTVSLAGIGTDFSLGAQTSGSTSATVTAGKTATYNLQVAPTGYSGTVNLSCSGAPVAARCTVSPASLSVTGSTAAMFTVTVTTTARGGVLGDRRPPMRLNPLPAVCLLGAAGLCFALFRSRPKLTLAFMALTLFGITVAGCGGGSNSNGIGAGTGTPAGASTLTINAASGGVTRTVQLSLTVN